MSNNLVSMQNLETILKAVRLGVINKINAKDITADQKAILEKADLIDTTTNNNGFLADNGTYVHIDVDAINDIHTKTQVVKDLFDIDYLDTAYAETLNTTIPSVSGNYASSIYYNGKIYCIGENYIKVEIYDIANNTWSAGQQLMNTLRIKFGCVEYNGKIYCIGGYNSNSQVISNIEIYDIANDTWTTISATMPTPRYDFGCVVYNGKIYCIGGTDGVNDLNNIDVFNISDNTWTTIDVKMTTARKKFGCVGYNGKIYCIGGTSNNSVIATTEIYDINNNVWTTGTNITTPRTDFQSVEFEGSIYCTGGKDSNGNVIGTTDIYKVSSNTWSSGLSLPNSRYAYSICISDKGIIYYISGSNSAVLNTIDAVHLPFTHYVLNLPQELQDKLNLIVDNGDGTKVLADNGQFIDIPLGYRFMTDTEVTNMVSTINSYTGA